MAKPIPLHPRHVLFKRVLKGGLLSFSMISISLAIGMLGYHEFAGLGLVDSLLNASMILTGMGPVTPMVTNAGKIFASIYALFSGITFLISASALLEPVYRHLMHKFHLEIYGEGEK